MYHATIAKDYKPLQKPLGLGVRLFLPTAGAAGVPARAGCGRAAPERVPAGGNRLRDATCGAWFWLLPIGAACRAQGHPVFCRGLGVPRCAEAGLRVSVAKRAAWGP